MPNARHKGMHFELLHPRDQLVAIMNRIYHGGMTTLSGGNLSIRDANGDIWITPSGIDKGELLPQDIMRVRADGAVEGPHKPSMEVPFHRTVYALRPDLYALVHAHPPALISYSIVREVPDTAVLPRVRHICGPVGYAPYALPGSEALGANIANTFAGGCDIVILENHGAVAGGASLLEAFYRLEALDFCARTVIRARALGALRAAPAAPPDLFAPRLEQPAEFVPAAHSSRERELRQQIVEIATRACDRQLMTSSAGVVSARLDGDSFLITPAGLDRHALAAADIVLIHRGRREAGKLPSRSLPLHEAIYALHPDIACVVAAQPPNATAYAIADVRFDSRTIPESYVLLREVSLVPFTTLHTRPGAVAESISLRNPVLLLANEGVLTVGTECLTAFDRLEVAEFSARSLIDTAVLGPLVPIGEEDINDLRRAFGLP